MEIIELKESLSELKSIEDNLRSTLKGNLNYQKQTRIRIAELESGLTINDRVKVKFMASIFFVYPSSFLMCDFFIFLFRFTQLGWRFD